MFKVIKIGEKDVELLSNAATPYRFKQVFGKDLMKEMLKSKDDNSNITDLIPQLAFLMNSQATGKDLNKLNFDSFIDWTVMFETMEIIEAGEDIINVYLGTNNSTSDLKKKQKNRPRNKY